MLKGSVSLGLSKLCRYDIKDDPCGSQTKMGLVNMTWGRDKMGVGVGVYTESVCTIQTGN